MSGDNWKHQQSQAEIRISYRTLKEAEAVARAVSPDNVNLPLGLYIRTKRDRKNVLTLIRCRTKLKTFMATIDDLLSAVSVAERTLSAAK